MAEQPVTPTLCAGYLARIAEIRQCLRVRIPVHAIGDAAPVAAHERMGLGEEA